ncbi:hypothetical protein NONO_c17270 [Nocardia nova SH22a]|uniref:Asp23 family protein n=1 Tax=Nocardia nova SH22a TaxID=1415166 RepID=W5TC29_9NOCA|nr:hypothetical protein [Nocardia nova]AHH16528.1 hypothetical protein NONO_c17270 [Nocardia nova SH22a]
MTADELIDRIVAAIDAVDGLRPTVPAGVALPDWVPRLGPHSAVDVAAEAVEIRVTATALPLPPLLDRLSAAVKEILAPTPWAAARLRIVVTDLDAGALDTTGRDDSRPAVS